MIRYASADPSRLLAFGSVNRASATTSRAIRARVIDGGARALKVHPPHQLFRANAYQDTLPALADLYRVAEERRRAGDDPHRHVCVPRRAQPLRRSDGRRRRGDRLPEADDPARARRAPALDGSTRSSWSGAIPTSSSRCPGIPPAKLLEYFPGSKRSPGRRSGAPTGRARDQVDEDECRGLSGVAVERRREAPSWRATRNVAA